MSKLKETMLEFNLKDSGIFWILLAACVLRLLHLKSAVLNPITYHPGADESFYIDFGIDVANAFLSLSPEYIFMDPLYGYFIGAIFYLFGKNVFAVYIFQIIIDLVTVYLIYLFTIIVFNKRAALIAGFLYALSASSIFYTTTILKPTLVSHFISLWILLSVLICQSDRVHHYLVYGFFLGVGVALRSNLLLFLFPAIFIIWYSEFYNKSAQYKFLSKAGVLMLGFLMVCVLLAVRNHSISGYWSFLPPNSGIVLHQLYNENNPEAVQYAPEFVDYDKPRDILRGYIDEAQIQSGRKMNVYEVSDYWRDIAITHIFQNPVDTIRNLLRKTSEFISYREISNSRYINQERDFSIVMKFIPISFGILFVLGLPGLYLLFAHNRINALPTLFALLIVFTTFIFFLATARFRTHGVPILAIGSGVLISEIIQWQKLSKSKLLSIVLIIILLSGLTLWSGQRMPPESDNYINFAWGYLKMGQPELASSYAIRHNELYPHAAGPHELFGYIAYNEKRYDDAILHYGMALKLEPDQHITKYNLALALYEENNYDEALIIIKSAIDNVKEPDYLDLMEKVLNRLNTD